jgi:hypothetical protein
MRRFVTVWARVFLAAGMSLANSNAVLAQEMTPIISDEGGEAERDREGRYKAGGYMKALGAALMAAGVCSLAAVGVAVFGLAPRTFGRGFLAAPYSQFIAFLFAVALIASGAVFRRFDDIMQVALDASRDATRSSQDQNEPNH